MWQGARSNACRKRKPLIWASAQEGWMWMVGLPKLPETVGCTVCSLPPHCKLLFRSVATISQNKKARIEEKTRLE